MVPQEVSVHRVSDPLWNLLSKCCIRMLFQSTLSKATSSARNSDNSRPQIRQLCLETASCLLCESTAQHSVCVFFWFFSSKRDKWPKFKHFQLTQGAHSNMLRKNCFVFTG